MKPPAKPSTSATRRRPTITATFPDPDLVPVEVDDAWIAQIKSEIGEMPAVRRKRYIEALGLSPVDAAILASDRATGDYFEQVLAGGVEPRRASTLMEALREMANEQQRLGPDAARHRPAPVWPRLPILVNASKLAASKEVAKKVIAAVAEQDQPAEQAATTLGLIQSSDTGAVDAAIDALIAQNPKSLQDYRAGKQAALGSLVGMVMKSAKGLNPKVVQERLKGKFN